MTTINANPALPQAAIPKANTPVAKSDDGDIDGAVPAPAKSASQASNAAVNVTLSSAAKAIVGGSTGA